MARSVSPKSTALKPSRRGGVDPATHMPDDETARQAADRLRGEDPAVGQPVAPEYLRHEGHEERRHDTLADTGDRTEEEEHDDYPAARHEPQAIEPFAPDGDPCLRGASSRRCGLPGPVAPGY